MSSRASKQDSNGLSTSPKSPKSPSPAKQTSAEDALDAIQLLSLEEVTVQQTSPTTETSSSSSRHSSRPSSRKSRKEKSGDGESGGCLKGLRSRHKGAGHGGKAPSLPPSTNMPSGAIFYPQNADSNIVISGHQDLNSLYASNDMASTGPIMVNVCNAPNNSTVQCGCENINCPFCNLMLSIEKMDPSVLQ